MPIWWSLFGAGLIGLDAMFRRRNAKGQTEISYFGRESGGFGRRCRPTELSFTCAECGGKLDTRVQVS
jgi:hypothetical protein